LYERKKSAVDVWERPSHVCSPTTAGGASGDMRTGREACSREVDNPDELFSRNLLSEFTSPSVSRTAYADSRPTPRAVSEFNIIGPPDVAYEARHEQLLPWVALVLVVDHNHEVVRSLFHANNVVDELLFTVPEGNDDSATCH
jgi:hypothetical protein